MHPPCRLFLVQALVIGKPERFEFIIRKRYALRRWRAGTRRGKTFGNRAAGYTAFLARTRHATLSLFLAYAKNKDTSRLFRNQVSLRLILGKDPAESRVGIAIIAAARSIPSFFNCTVQLNFRFVRMICGYGELAGLPFRNIGRGENDFFW